jgi:integrase
MVKRSWPTGIRPSGRGLRIRIWRNRQILYSETIEGDPFNARVVAAAVKRRDELNARAKLKLPLFAGDDTPNQTVVQAAQTYIEGMDTKRSTALGYETMLNTYWLPHIGHWPIVEVTSSKIKEILAGLKVSAKTKKNILGPLRGVLTSAGINPNPATGIEFRKRQKVPVERYTPQQRASLLSVLTGQAKVYFALLFACGLRPGEALALRWTDYDGEELDVSKQITRRRLENSTKTSKRRRVYVPTWARAILNEHTTRFTGEWIFVNETGDHYKDTDILNDAWRSAHKKARLPYRVPYVCRHTRAAELLSIGITPADAAKQLGNSPEIFLRTYSEFIEQYAQNQNKARFEGVGVDNLPTKAKG